MAILHYVSTNHQFLGILLGTKGKLCSNCDFLKNPAQISDFPGPAQGWGSGESSAGGLDFEVRRQESPPPVPPPSATYA